MNELPERLMYAGKKGWEIEMQWCRVKGNLLFLIEFDKKKSWTLAIVHARANAHH